ncbi:MAG TPA: peptidase M55 [Chloroflexi bacterium]|nr:peptidase M55 [Chloroflexota bacterium]
MKIFIASDMEGVSGVVHREHTGWDGRRHYEARKWMTEHINAAVQGAVDMDATEVLVCDGHSNGRNVILDLLHPEATLVWGRQNRRLGQMQGIDETFDAVLMVGFHARAGSLGVLNHTTNSGVVSEVRVNGEPVGEIDINAAIAGEFGVPVAMVSGDATAVAEAQERMPHIETAAVMEAIGTYSAKILPPPKAHALIREATMRALDRLDDMPPTRYEPPIRLEMRFFDTAMADAAAMIPGAERLDSRACGYTCRDFLEAYQVHWIMIVLATSERWANTP